MFWWNWDNCRSRRGKLVSQSFPKPLRPVKNQTDLWHRTQTANVQHKWTSIYPNPKQTDTQSHWHQHTWTRPVFWPTTEPKRSHRQPPMSGLQGIRKRRYSQINPDHHPGCPAVHQRKSKYSNRTFFSKGNNDISISFYASLKLTYFVRIYKKCFIHFMIWHNVYIYHYYYLLYTSWGYMKYHLH